jgi:hypothetical protein
MALPETDVSPEREYAQHLAYRLLSEMAAALLESRPGTVGVPKVDPIFGAIVGRSMQILADQLKTSGAPASAEIEKQNPGDRNTGAKPKEK